MQGKTCVVTGGNSGIGNATAAGLAERGARVIIVSRTRQRGEAAVADLRARTGNEAIELARLAALVPRPRANTPLYFGV